MLVERRRLGGNVVEVGRKGVEVVLEEKKR